MAENVDIGEGAVVGERPEDMTDIKDWGVAVVAQDVKVAAGATVKAKAMIDADVKGDE